MTRQYEAGVVVATHNRADLLPRLLRALERQHGIEAFEVVVVDDASTDDTPSVLDELARTASVPVRIHRIESNRGPATARNLGWRASTAPYIAFTDDDCVPQAGWLESLVDALGTNDVAQGRTMPDPAQAAHHGPFSRTLDVKTEDGFYQTCNIAYRRSVLERLGGFDEHFRHPAGEDTDLAWRARDAGAATTFVDGAVVYHDVRRSRFRTHLRDTWRWEGCVLTIRKHPGLRSLIWRRVFLRATHPPALLGGLGLVIVVVAIGRPLAQAAGLALLIPYARLRIWRWPLSGGPRRRLAAIPGAFVADLAESLAMIVASVRYRTFVL